MICLTAATISWGFQHYLIDTECFTMMYTRCLLKCVLYLSNSAYLFLCSIFLGDIIDWLIADIVKHKRLNLTRSRPFIVLLKVTSSPFLRHVARLMPFTLSPSRANLQYMPNGIFLQHRCVFQQSFNSILVSSCQYLLKNENPFRHSLVPI